MFIPWQSLVVKNQILGGLIWVQRTCNLSGESTQFGSSDPHPSRHIPHPTVTEVPISTSASTVGSSGSHGAKGSINIPDPKKTLQLPQPMPFITCVTEKLSDPTKNGEIWSVSNQRIYGLNHLNPLKSPSCLLKDHHKCKLA
jgi:hypothetical protein